MDKMRIAGLWIVAMFFLLGSSGCAKNLGQNPCAINECYGQAVWQQAIDEIAEKNFPGERYTGKVYRDPLRNAWTTDDQNVHISQGLLRELIISGYSHVLSVASHEIAHIRLSHYRIKDDASYVSHTDQGGIVLNDKEAVALLSRKHELEADALAVRYLTNTGYSKEDYLHFLYWIKVNMKDAPPTKLATHPTTIERIARIQMLEFSRQN